MDNPIAFLQKYAIHRKLPNSDQTILREQATNQYVLMKEVCVADHEEFKKVVETLESQKYLSHDHLLSLVDYHSAPHYDQSTQVTSRKLITFFEYSSHNLLEEIEARIESGRMFTEPQLWSILTSSVLALAYLQRQAIGHGCVSPLDIFVEDDGAVKIVDPSIASSSPFTIIQGYYYSPEIFQHVSSEIDPPPQVDIFKADSFSLAVCMLHAGLLDSMDDCFDYNQYLVDFDRLQEKLESFCQVYSMDLANIIVSMLNEQIQNRPDFVKLEEDLSSVLDRSQSLNDSQALSQNFTLSQQFQNSLIASQQSSRYTPTSQFKLHNASLLASRKTVNVSPPCAPLHIEQEDAPNEPTGAPIFTTSEVCKIDTQEIPSTDQLKGSNVSSNSGSIPAPRSSFGSIPLPQHGPPKLLEFSRPTQQVHMVNYLMPQTQLPPAMQHIPAPPQGFVGGAVEGMPSPQDKRYAIFTNTPIKSSLPSTPSKFTVVERPPVRPLENNSSIESSFVQSNQKLQKVVITTTTGVPQNVVPLTFSKQVVTTGPPVTLTNQRAVPVTVTTTKHDIIVSPYKQSSVAYTHSNNNQQIFTDPNLLAMMRQDVEKILGRSNPANKENQRVARP